MTTLQAQPLTAENFANYGHVIQSQADSGSQMNGTFARFDDLALIDSAESQSPTISIVRSQIPAALPYVFDLVECHPLCTQAFIPLSQFEFFVVVAPAGLSVEMTDLKAFRTNGKQGISYHRGTWHMPLIATAPNQEFLVIDQANRAGNLREQRFDLSVTLAA